jgi:hypothetical protein
LIFTLIVGAAWEIFEAKTGQTVISDAGYPLDTLADLFYDIFGAYFFTLLRIQTSDGK